MPYDKFELVRHSVISPHFHELVIIKTQALTESLIKKLMSLHNSMYVHRDHLTFTSITRDKKIGEISSFPSP